LQESIKQSEKFSLNSEKNVSSEFDFEVYDEKLERKVEED